MDAAAAPAGFSKRDPLSGCQPHQPLRNPSQTGACMHDSRFAEQPAPSGPAPGAMPAAHQRTGNVTSSSSGVDSGGSKSSSSHGDRGVPSTPDGRQLLPMHLVHPHMVGTYSAAPAGSIMSGAASPAGQPAAPASKGTPLGSAAQLTAHQAPLTFRLAHPTHAGTGMFMPQTLPSMQQQQQQVPPSTDSSQGRATAMKLLWPRSPADGTLVLVPVAGASPQPAPNHTQRQRHSVPGIMSGVSTMHLPWTPVTAPKGGVTFTEVPHGSLWLNGRRLGEAAAQPAAAGQPFPTPQPDTCVRTVMVNGVTVHLRSTAVPAAATPHTDPSLAAQQAQHAQQQHQQQRQHQLWRERQGSRSARTVSGTGTPPPAGEAASPPNGMRCLPTVVHASSAAPMASALHSPGFAVPPPPPPPPSVGRGSRVMAQSAGLPSSKNLNSQGMLSGGAGAHVTVGDRTTHPTVPTAAASTWQLSGSAGVAASGATAITSHAAMMGAAGKAPPPPPPPPPRASAADATAALVPPPPPPPRPSLLCPADPTGSSSNLASPVASSPLHAALAGVRTFALPAAAPIPPPPPPPSSSKRTDARGAAASAPLGAAPAAGGEIAALKRLHRATSEQSQSALSASTPGRPTSYPPQVAAHAATGSAANGSSGFTRSGGNGGLVGSGDSARHPSLRCTTMAKGEPPELAAAGVSAIAGAVPAVTAAMTSTLDPGSLPCDDSSVQPDHATFFHLPEDLLTPPGSFSAMAPAPAPTPAPTPALAPAPALVPQLDPPASPPPDNAADSLDYPHAAAEDDEITPDDIAALLSSCTDTALARLASLTALPPPCSTWRSISCDLYQDPSRDSGAAGDRSPRSQDDALDNTLLEALASQGTPYNTSSPDFHVTGPAPVCGKRQDGPLGVLPGGCVSADVAAAASEAGATVDDAAAAAVTGVAVAVAPAVSHAARADSKPARGRGPASVGSAVGPTANEPNNIVAAADLDLANDGFALWPLSHTSHSSLSSPGYSGTPTALRQPPAALEDGLGTPAALTDRPSPPAPWEDRPSPLLRQTVCNGQGTSSQAAGHEAPRPTLLLTAQTCTPGSAGEPAGLSVPTGLVGHSFSSGPAGLVDCEVDCSLLPAPLCPTGDAPVAAELRLHEAQAALGPVSGRPSSERLSSNSCDRQGLLRQGSDNSYAPTPPAAAAATQRSASCPAHEQEAPAMGQAPAEQRGLAQAQGVQVQERQGSFVFSKVLGRKI